MATLLTQPVYAGGFVSTGLAWRQHSWLTTELSFRLQLLPFVIASPNSGLASAPPLFGVGGTLRIWFHVLGPEQSQLLLAPSLACNHWEAWSVGAANSIEPGGFAAGRFALGRNVALTVGLGLEAVFLLEYLSFRGILRPSLLISVALEL